MYHKKESHLLALNLPSYFLAKMNKQWTCLASHNSTRTFTLEKENVSTHLEVQLNWETEPDLVSTTQYYLFERISDGISNSITGINDIKNIGANLKKKYMRGWFRKQAVLKNICRFGLMIDDVLILSIEHTVLP